MPTYTIDAFTQQLQNMFQSHAETAKSDNTKNEVQFPNEDKNMRHVMSSTYSLNIRTIILISKCDAWIH